MLIILLNQNKLLFLLVLLKCIPVKDFPDSNKLF